MSSNPPVLAWNVDRQLSAVTATGTASPEQDDENKQPHSAIAQKVSWTFCRWFLGGFAFWNERSSFHSAFITRWMLRSFQFSVHVVSILHRSCAFTSGPKPSIMCRSHFYLGSNNRFRQLLTEWSVIRGDPSDPFVPWLKWYRSPKFSVCSDVFGF